MSRDIIATIVTEKGVTEKKYTAEDDGKILSSFIIDSVHSDCGHDVDVKFIDSDYSEPLLMFPDYYSDSHRLTWSEKYPYIIRDNKVEWRVPFGEVTIEDFVSTHNLDKDDPIKVNVGGGIGGFGDEWFQLCDWLTVMAPYFDAFKDNIQFIAAVIAIIQCFRDRDGSVMSPKEVRAFVRSKGRWSEDEFEEISGMDEGPELDSLMDYSEFKRKNDTFIRQDCSAEEHMDKILLANQKIWGQYYFDDTIDDIAAQLHDINKLTTEIMLLSQEFESDSYDIAMAFIDAFRHRWQFSVQKGSHFQILQLIPCDGEMEETEELDSDISSLRETLETIRLYLTSRLPGEGVRHG